MRAAMPETRPVTRGRDGAISALDQTGTKVRILLAGCVAERNAVDA
jgi:hypothetical protein